MIRICNIAVEYVIGIVYGVKWLLHMLWCYLMVIGIPSAYIRIVINENIVQQFILRYINTYACAHTNTIAVTLNKQFNSILQLLSVCNERYNEGVLIRRYTLNSTYCTSRYMHFSTSIKSLQRLFVSLIFFFLLVVFPAPLIFAFAVDII